MVMLLHHVIRYHMISSQCYYVSDLYIAAITFSSLCDTLYGSMWDCLTCAPTEIFVKKTDHTHLHFLELRLLCCLVYKSIVWPKLLL